MGVKFFLEICFNRVLPCWINNFENSVILAPRIIFFISSVNLPTQTVYPIGVIVYQLRNRINLKTVFIFFCISNLTVHHIGVALYTNGATLYPNDVTVYPNGIIVYRNVVTEYSNVVTVYSNGVKKLKISWGSTLQKFSDQYSSGYYCLLKNFKLSQI